MSGSITSPYIPIEWTISTSSRVNLLSGEVTASGTASAGRSLGPVSLRVLVSESNSTTSGTSSTMAIETKVKVDNSYMSYRVGIKF